MRKSFFTLVLVIASSVWTMSSALCIARAPQMQQSTETLSGYFVMEGTPCESTVEPCLPCLTLAFQSNETLYYLTSDNDQMMSQLNEIEAQFIEGQHATINGISYQQGSYNYINVQTVSIANSPLPSLCNEWHMLVPGFSWPYTEKNYMHRLASDTLIGGQHYVQLESNETGTFAYEGAMRESESKVYYIPAGSTHEYLLYDFNVQVGDTLTNLWIGGQESEYELSLIRDIIVEDIEGTAPSRKFYISFTYDYWQGMFRWIEGVGLNEGPAGWYYVPGTPVDPTPEILCAYKDGKRVYATSQAEQHSCCYNAQKINSLCDTWNVLEVDGVTCGGCEVYRTMKYCLTTDTIIGSTHYVKLMKGNAYEGALREGIHRDIYYIPNGSTHEYLLYDFNAQVGDKLTNLWVGDTIKSATIIEIEPTTPRTFVLSVEYYQSGYLDTTTVAWIEGVGSLAGPTGRPGFIIPNSRAYSVLCAYKNGEQIYVSEMGEQYGCEYNGNGTPEPMFTSDTEWHYKSYDMFAYTDYTPTLSSISLVDTLINNIPYQKIGGILFRTKGTKVWCTMDSLGTPVERLVYDFDLQVGDSIRNVYYDEEFWMEQEYIRYAKVTSVEYITLSDGRSARRISYDNYRPDDIEHIGSVEGILFPLNFPVAECGCGDAFKCCTRNDFLLYEVSTGACDDFFEAEQPADTIPLYIQDDPGSSTVDPVDPNQVVATLKGDELTIREYTGVDITYSLQHNAPSQMPSVHRAPQSDTFRDMVTLQITESGEYQLLLTNPSWGYSIFGNFIYAPQGIEQISSSSQGGKTSRLVLVNGQIFILRGEKIYTVTGQEVR